MFSSSSDADFMFQLSGKKWMLVKSTQVTQEIQTEVTVCAPLCEYIASLYIYFSVEYFVERLQRIFLDVSGNCQASEFEIDVSSETEMKYIVYGYDGSCV